MSVSRIFCVELRHSRQVHLIEERRFRTPCSCKLKKLLICSERRIPQRWQLASAPPTRQLASGQRRLGQLRLPLPTLGLFHRHGLQGCKPVLLALSTDFREDFGPEQWLEGSNNGGWNSGVAVWGAPMGPWVAIPSEEPSKPGAPPKASGGLNIGLGTPTGTMVLAIMGFGMTRVSPANKMIASSCSGGLGNSHGQTVGPGKVPSLQFVLSSDFIPALSRPTAGWRLGGVSNASAPVAAATLRRFWG